MQPPGQHLRMSLRKNFAPIAFPYPSSIEKSRHNRSNQVSIPSGQCELHYLRLYKIEFRHAAFTWPSRIHVCETIIAPENAPNHPFHRVRFGHVPLLGEMPRTQLVTGQVPRSLSPRPLPARSLATGLAVQPLLRRQRKMDLGVLLEGLAGHLLFGLRSQF